MINPQEPPNLSDIAFCAVLVALVGFSVVFVCYVVLFFDNLPL